MKRSRIPKYIWLPLILFIYLTAIVCIFGRDMLAAGQTLRFGLTVGANLLIIIVLAVLLRYSDRLRREREEDMRTMD